MQKFKKRHGIKFLNVCDDKKSADHEAVVKFIEFAKVITEENLMSKQVYNANETLVFWHYSRKILTIADETGDEDCSILLLFLVNCSAHPPTEIFIRNSIYAVYHPKSNFINSAMQSLDQSIC